MRRYNSLWWWLVVGARQQAKLLMEAVFEGNVASGKVAAWLAISVKEEIL